MKILFLTLFILLICACNLNVDLRGPIKNISASSIQEDVLSYSNGFTIGINLSGKISNPYSRKIQNLTGEKAKVFLKELNLSWSSTGFVTYAPSSTVVEFEHGFIWIYDKYLIVGNFVENESQISEISKNQFDEINDLFGINAVRSKLTN
jgi:hypothetical protein